jgi:hypothetical protein
MLVAVVAVAALLAVDPGAAASAPQESGGGFAAHGEARGTVRDEAGQPIADARLSFSLEGRSTFRDAMAEAWRAMPVPSVATGADGAFVWPLLHDQRLAFDMGKGCSLDGVEQRQGLGVDRDTGEARRVGDGEARAAAGDIGPDWR